MASVTEADQRVASLVGPQVVDNLPRTVGVELTFADTLAIVPAFYGEWDLGPQADESDSWVGADKYHKALKSNPFVGKRQRIVNTPKVAIERAFRTVRRGKVHQF